MDNLRNLYAMVGGSEYCVSDYDEARNALEALFRLTDEQWEVADHRVYYFENGKFVYVDDWSFGSDGLEDLREHPIDYYRRQAKDA